MKSIGLCRKSPNCAPALFDSCRSRVWDKLAHGVTSSSQLIVRLNARRGRFDLVIHKMCLHTMQGGF
jgi:hypothetical protein